MFLKDRLTRSLAEEWLQDRAPPINRGTRCGSPRWQASRMTISKRNHFGQSPAKHRERETSWMLKPRGLPRAIPRSPLPPPKLPGNGSRKLPGKIVAPAQEEKLREKGPLANGEWPQKGRRNA
jgi:hypothetical protein